MMQSNIPQKAEQYAKKQGRYRVWQRIVLTLACAVVFCTTYALIIPAITMERAPSCGFENHQHTEFCYEVRSICGFGEAHTHSDGCYSHQQLLVCTQEESSGHIHSDSCIHTEQILACTQEHEHAPECFTASTTYVCATAEGKGAHTHAPQCYETQTSLTCTQQPHVHTDGCYERVLTCQKEEHHHSDTCYPSVTEATEQTTEATEQTTVATEETTIATEETTIATEETTIATEETTEATEETTEATEEPTEETQEQTELMEVPIPELELYVTDVFFSDTVYDAAGDHFDTVMHVSFRIPVSVLSVGELYECNYQLPGNLSPRADLMWSASPFHFGTVLSGSAARAGVFTFTYEGNHCLCVLNFDRNAVSGDVVEGNLRFDAEISPSALREDGTILVILSNGVGVSIPAPEMPSPETEPTEMTTEATEETTEATEETTEATEETTEATEETTEETNEPSRENIKDSIKDAIKDILGDKLSLGGLDMGASNFNMTETSDEETSDNGDIMPLDGESQTVTRTDMRPYIGSDTSFTSAKYNPVTNQVEVGFHMTFAMTQAQIKAANYAYSYALPEGIIIPDNMLNTTYSGYDQSGALGFTYRFVSDGDGTYSVLVDFDKTYVDSRDHFSGYINFGAYAGKRAEQSNGSYSFQFSDDCTVTIPADRIEHEANESQYYNVSVAKTNGGYDATNNKITYTVTVSSSKGTPDPLNLTDVLTANGLNVSNVELVSVKKYTIDQWGNESWGSETQVSCNLNYSNNQITMQLQALRKVDDTHGEKYTITYDVYLDEPVAGSTYTVDNKVTVTGTDSQNNQTVTSEAESHASIDKSLSLVKYGTYDKTTDKIKWTIVVNQNGNNIAGVTLQDAMFSGSNVSVSVTPSEGQYRVNDTITFIGLNNTGVNKQQYTITYETDAPAVDANGTASVQNTATLNPPTGDSKTVTATVNIDKQLRMTKYGSYDKASDTITWTITINENGNDIAGAELTDSMFSQLKASSITVSPNQEGMTIVTNGDTISKITFSGVNGDTNTKTYIITYTTPSGVNAGGSGTVTNTASFDPTPDGNTGDEITSGPGVWVDRTLGFDKSDGWYDSSKRGIRWMITVNSGNDNIAGYKLTDTMFNSLVPGTLNINWSHVNSDSTVEGAKINWNDDGTVSSIEFTGIDNTSVNTQKYTIEYYAAAKPGWDPVTVTNTAKLTPPTGDPITDTGTSHVPAEGNVLKKCMGATTKDTEGKIAITWRTEIQVPADGLHEGTVVTDTLANDGQWMDWLQIQKWGSVLFAKQNSNSYTPDINYWWPVGQTYTITFYATDGTTCTYDDIVANTNGAQNKQFTKYEINFVNGVPADTYGRKTIYFEYDSYVNVSNVADSATYKNTVTVTPPDGNPKSGEASYTYKTPGVVKMDGNGQTGTSNISTTDGVLTWRVRVRLDSDCTKLTVTDTLPAGVTLTGLTFVNSPLTISENNTISGNPDGLNATGTITTDSNSQQVVTLTVTLPNGATAPSYFKANGELYLVYTCKISDSLLSQGQNSTDHKIGTFTNTVTVKRDETLFPPSSQTQEVTYNQPSSGLDKVNKTGGWNNDARILEYSILLNPDAADLLPESDTLTLTDKLLYWIGEQSNKFNTALLPASVQLHQAVLSDGKFVKGDLITNWSWKVETSENASEYTSTITATIPDSTALILSYSYRVWVPEGSDFDDGQHTYWGLLNTATLTGETSWSDESRFDVKWEDAQTSAGITSDRAYVFYKVEQGNYGNSLPGAEFKLYDANGNALKTYTTDSNGSFTIQWQSNPVKQGEFVFQHNTLYYVQETKAPDGYLMPQNPQKYWFYFKDSTDTTYTLPDIIPDGAVDLSSTAGFAYCENARNVTGIAVQKQWFTPDGTEVTNSTASPITFDLYQLASTTPPAEGSGSGGSSGGSADGMATVTWQFGYWNPDADRQVLDNVERNYRIGSTITFSITSYGEPVVKTYVSGGTFNNNGIPLTDPTTSGSNPTTYTYTYTVQGDITIGAATNDGSASASIPDSHSPDTGGTEDSGSTAVPAGGTLIGTYTISASDGWKWSRDDLPKTGVDDSGNTLYYTYYVVESVHAGYDVSYENNGGIASGTITIKNKETSGEKTSITVNKIWRDIGNKVQDTIPETEITYELFQIDSSGKEVSLGTYTVGTSNNWTSTHSNLPVGYTYKVVEEAIGYLIAYSTDDGTTFVADPPAVSSGTVTIRNTYDTTNITVNKQWFRGETQITDPTQMPEITFNLYRKAGEKGTEELVQENVKLNSDNGWKAEFNNIQARRKWDGIEYLFYVCENGSTENWEVSYSGDNVKSGTITIKNTIPLKKLIVTKEWRDASGTLLTDTGSLSAQVKLYRKSDNQMVTGTDIENPVTLNHSNNFTHEWVELPDGEYYVVEEPVSGFSTRYFASWVTGTTDHSQASTGNDGTIRVVNTRTHSPAPASVTAEKVWEPSAPTDKTVTLQLYRAQAVVQEETLGDLTYYGVMGGTTTADYYNYPSVMIKVSYGSGSGQKRCVFYQSAPDGWVACEWFLIQPNQTLYFPLRNYAMPEKGIAFNAWGDEADNPYAVTAQLVRVTATGITGNPEKVGETVTLNSPNWNHTWNNLAVTDGNGKFYAYYVAEESVPEGYQVSYSVNGVDKETAASAALIPNGSITVTNTKPDETTSISVKKVWQDSSGKELTEKPLSEITFDLYQLASGETSTEGKTPILSGLTVKSQSAESVTSGNYTITYGAWETTISNLPAEDSSGNAYTYYVVETAPTGYQVSYSNGSASSETGSSVTAGANGTITITNTQTPTPSGTSLTVEKKWSGESDRPSEITFELHQVAHVESSGETDPTETTAPEETTEPETTERVTVTVQNAQWNPDAVFLTTPVPIGAEVTVRFRSEESEPDGKFGYYTNDQNNVTTLSGTQLAVEIEYPYPDNPSYSITWYTYSITFTALDHTRVYINNGYKTNIECLAVTYTSDSASPSSYSLSRAVDTYDGEDKVYETVTISNTDGWKKTFYNLPASAVTTDGNPVTYTYYVVETAPATGYEVSYSNGEGASSGNGSEVTTDANGSLIITNTKTTVPATMSMSVRKNWQNPDGTAMTDVPYSASVQLRRAKLEGKVTYNQTGDIDAKYLNSRYKLIVSFEALKEGYQEYQPGSICTKNWENLSFVKVTRNDKGTCYYVFDLGAFSQYSEGVKFNFWSAVYDENGDPVDTYTSLNSATIVEIPDNPIFEDCGEPVTLTGTATQYTWNNLERMASDGSYWIYTVEETEVKQGDTDVSNLFTTTITPDNGLCDTGTFTITNTKGTELTVRKVWKAADGVTDLTPGNAYSATVQLYQVATTDGTTETTEEIYPTVTLDNYTNWEYTWIDLPAMNGNTTYTYYVEEVSMSNGGEANFGNQFHVTVDHGDQNSAIGPSGTVTVTNTLKSTYTLPETGGGGAKPYTLGGLLLCFTAGALLLYSHSSRRKEDFTSS